MLRKLHERARDEKGFTLIELLVVILIIGILAAIAIPSFINQRSKGQDASAKAAAKTAAEAQETWFTDNQSYTAQVSDLQNIEPTLRDSTGLSTTRPSSDAYTVTAISQATGSPTFTISRAANGTTTRLCSAAGSGGCRATADANGNSW